MKAIALDQAIDTALQLPPEQQEMLVDILRRRQIESRRAEIAHDARKSLKDARAGKLMGQSAQDVIADLHRALDK